MGVLLINYAYSDADSDWFTNYSFMPLLKNKATISTMHNITVNVICGDNRHTKMVARKGQNKLEIDLTWNIFFYHMISLQYWTTWLFMPWLCVDHMIQQGVWPMGFSYPDPLANPDHWQNPDPLVKSRPTGWDTK